MSETLPLIRREGATYLPLAAFAPLPRRTRFHDDAGILKAIGHFGLIDTPAVNTTTGHTLAGWGRVTALRVMQRAGDGPPAGVLVEDGDDDWLVPVHPAAVPAAQEEAAALALNKLVENGGYDEIKLLAVLEDLRATPARLDAAGFHEAEVEYLARALCQAPPDSAPKEKPPETHKRFVVGAYRWQVEIETYVAWAAALRAEARGRWVEAHAGEEADAERVEALSDLDLKPYLRAILRERLGLDGGFDTEDEEAGGDGVEDDAGDTENDEADDEEAGGDDLPETD